MMMVQQILLEKPRVELAAKGVFSGLIQITDIAAVAAGLSKSDLLWVTLNNASD